MQIKYYYLKEINKYLYSFYENTISSHTRGKNALSIFIRIQNQAIVWTEIHRYCRDSKVQ